MAASPSRRTAVVLAGGQGKRMGSTLPKVLHEVLGRAIIKRVLDCLDELDLEHVYIVVGHQHDKVADFVDSKPPATPYSLYVQERQLGTGHALMQVQESLKSFAGPVLVVPADTPLITASTLAAFLDEHGKKKALVSCLTMMMDAPGEYGRIVRGRSGRLTRIVEYRDATSREREICEVNSSIYSLAWPDVEAGLATLTAGNVQGEYYLTDLVGWASRNGLTVCASVAPDWREVAGVNTRADLAAANRMLSDKVIGKLMLADGVTVLDPSSTWIAPEVELGRDCLVLPGCYLVGEVKIGERCEIGPHTVMIGPVAIGSGSRVFLSFVSESSTGEGARVGPFAHLRAGAAIGDRVRVGNYVEVKASTVGDRTNISHLSYIGDARIGSGVNVGAGTITANYDHISRSKAATVIGDGASTGSNSVLVAPVTVGQEAAIAAGTVVTRDVPAGALAVARARQEVKTGWVEAKRRRLSSRPVG